MKDITVPFEVKCTVIRGKGPSCHIQSSHRDGCVQRGEAEAGARTVGEGWMVREAKR